MTSTNWSTVSINSTDFSSLQYASLSGIIMDDTVCRMDDSTYTLDDAKIAPITGINSSNFAAPATNSTSWT